MQQVLTAVHSRKQGLLENLYCVLGLGGSQTWAGSLETPSLLPVQIITHPDSWKGAPTAKSETQQP